MKDFRDKKLYDNEIGKFEVFLNEKLVTKSEYNKYDTGKEDEEEVAGIESVLGLGSFEDDGSDFMSGFGSNDDFGDFGGFGDFGADSSSKVDYEKHTREQNSIDMFLKAPLYLTDYTFNSLVYKTKDTNNDGIADSGNKINFDLKHTRDLFKYVGIAGLFLFSTSLLGQLANFNTLHNQTFGLIGGATAILSSDFFNWHFFNKGLIAKFIPNKDPKADKVSESDSETEENDLDGFGSFGDGQDFGSFEDDEEESAFSFDMNDLDDNEEDVDFDEDDDDEEEDTDGRVIPNSSVETSDDYVFKEGLIQEFIKNRRYEGRYLETRKETLDSFSGLLLNNDKSFAKWKVERERSKVFNNIAYTLYKALIDVDKSFATDESAKMTILSITHSPLLYKIEMKLPQKHFKGDKLQSRVSDINNHLKRDAADTEVLATVSISGDTYTIRLLRLDYKGLISIGDILRYVDDGAKGTAYEQMINPKALTPMLVGLRDNEYPHVVDLEKNTAMAIVGGSGSGKSWLTYELGTNIITTNDYNEVNFMILDLKNAPFWQAFARMPHVVGYHAPNPNQGYSNKDFLDDALKISAEIVQECYRRQSVLNELEMEDAIELRSTFKKQKKFDELKKFPLLIFVIDEITSTMGELEEDKDSYEAFRTNLKIISQVGRSAGVRLLTVGQRAIDKSLPKNVRANSTLLFGMKMNAQSDFGMLFEGSKEVERMPKPTGAGQGIITSEDIMGYHSLKTLTPGGKDTPQIRMLLRTMAFDWLRRAKGRDDLYQKPYGTNFEVGFNRPKFLDISYTELEEGKLFNKTDIYPQAVERLRDFTPQESERKNYFDNTPTITENLSEPDLNTVDSEPESFVIVEESVAETPDFNNNYDNSTKDNESFFEEKEPEVSPLNLTEFGNINFDEYPDDDFGDSIGNIDFEKKFSDDNIEYDENDFDDDEEEFFEINSQLETEMLEKKTNDFTDIEENDLIETDEKDTGIVENIGDNFDSLGEEDDIFAYIEEQPDDFQKEKEEFERIAREKELEILRREQELKEKEEKLKELERLEKEAEIKAQELKNREEILNKQREAQRIEQELKAEEQIINQQKPMGQQSRKQKPMKNTNMVQIGYKNSIDKKQPKVYIREFIFNNGKQIDDYTWALSKVEIEKTYTKAEISKALRLADIVESRDEYITSL